MSSVPAGLKSLKYQHRIDYPDVAISNQPTNKCVAASYVPVSTDAKYVGDAGELNILVGILDWNIDYIFKGPMTWELPPFYQGLTYQTIAGESITTEHLTSPGLSESVTKNVVHYRNKQTAFGETDKLNSSITYYNLETSSFISLQSSNDMIRFVDSYIAKMLLLPMFDKILFSKQRNCTVNACAVTGLPVLRVYGGEPYRTNDDNRCDLCEHDAQPKQSSVFWAMPRRHSSRARRYQSRSRTVTRSYLAPIVSAEIN